MIIFLTLYLGLVSGRQPVALQADGAVTSINILVDGAVIATIDGPPWRTEIDLGPALLPHEIVAVGLNANGAEVARASQFMNLPRRMGEIDLALARDANGKPVRATLVARHIAHEKVRSVSMKLDDHPLAVDKDLTAKMPAVDMTRPHVLIGETRFADGTAARREIVYGGQYAESAQTQLTPLVVTRTAAGDAPPPVGCFTANGVPLNVRSVELSTADVIIVRDPEPNNAYARTRRGAMPLGAQNAIATLDDLTFAHILSPVAQHINADDEATTLFPSSFTYDASKYGMFHALAWSFARGEGPMPRQWTDAVAVAGVNAVADGRRRAVILVLGDSIDYSQHQPAIVRRYLDVLGVPLFVWSVEGPRPDLAESWGDVDDVSTISKLREATDRIRRTLAAQRIVWVSADPFTALRAQIKDGCGYARIAHP